MSSDSGMKQIIGAAHGLTGSALFIIGAESLFWLCWKPLSLRTAVKIARNAVIIYAAWKIVRIGYYVSPPRD